MKSYEILLGSLETPYFRLQRKCGGLQLESGGLQRKYEVSNKARRYPNQQFHSLIEEFGLQPKHKDKVFIFFSYCLKSLIWYNKIKGTYLN